MTYGWIICIVLGGVAGFLDARQKITGRGLRFCLRRARRLGSNDRSAEPSAADAVANSAVNSALSSVWAVNSARRWLGVYGAELTALDGFAKLGGLSVFRCVGQNYLSFSESVSKETITGAPDQAAELLAALFGRLGFVPDAPERAAAVVSAEAAADPSNDMPAADIPDGFANDFYKDQTRAAWASNVDLSEPGTLAEVVANAFIGKKHFLDRADVARETGYNTELNKFNSFWAKSGGLSLVAWSEQIAADYSYTGLIPASYDCGGWDTQEIRNTIIDLFAGAGSPKDITEYTKRANLERLESLESIF